MAMLTLTSDCTTTTTTHLRDASFSSYLNSSDEAFVRKLAESSRDLHNPKTTPTNENFHFGRKKPEEEDGEIGVFGAEKYFNEGRDNEDGPRHSETNIVSQPRTPSVYSESSSWNSQSALLRTALRKPPPHHKRRSRSLLTSIRCINCSCNDGKSVDIGEKKKKKNPKRSLSFGGFEGKETIISSKNSAPAIKAELNPWIMKQIQTKKIDQDGFSFPVLSSKPRNINQQTEKPKKSLEVFGSPTMERNKMNSFNLDRRTPWNPSAGLEELDNGAESDASSDLFEIEDFRSDTKEFFLARNASDGMSSYAPSEDSIEWSVVTASAADFEDLVAASEAAGGYRVSPTRGKGGKDTEKRRSGMLSGCKSQKAVMVAVDAHRTNDPRMPYGSDSFGRSGTRFQAEARRTSFDSRNRPYSFDAGTLSR